MKKSTLIVVGLCSAGALAFALDRWKLQAEMKDLKQSYRVVAAERAAAADTRPTRPALPPMLARVQQPALEPRPEPVASAPDPAPATEPETVPPGGDDVAPSKRDQMAYVDMLFTNERADGRWARDAERTIGSTLTARIGNSTIELLECRETLCKARIAHDDENGFQQFIQRAFTPSFWNGAISSVRDAQPDASGRVRNTIYFTRDDIEMPTLP